MTCQSVEELDAIVESKLREVDNKVSNGNVDFIKQYLIQAMNYYDKYRSEIKKIGPTEKNPKYYCFQEAAYVNYKASQALLRERIPKLPGFGGYKSAYSKIYRELIEMVEGQEHEIAQIKSGLRKNFCDDTLVLRLRSLKSPSATQPKSLPDSTPTSQFKPKPSKPFSITINEEYISVDQLSRLLKTNPNDILLIDLRSRQEYDVYHIEDGSGVDMSICIEPMSIRNGYTAEDLYQLSMAVNPDYERRLFKNRSQYELLVCYGNYDNEATVQMFMTIMNKDTSLKRRSVYLKSGIKGWNQDLSFQDSKPNGYLTSTTDYFSNTPKHTITPKSSKSSSKPTLKTTVNSGPAHTVGINNLGNTCYMNCILQCLLESDKFVSFFLQGDYKKHININSRLGSRGILATGFHLLVLLISRSSGKTVTPSSFAKDVSTVNKNFKLGEQQDCFEFLDFLLDSLHEDLNECGNEPPIAELTPEEEKLREALPIRIASTIEWERYLKNNFSIVEDVFQGQYFSRLECTVCKSTSTTYNSFSSLSLPIPLDRQNVTLDDCFQAFCSVEELNGDDRWHCPSCKKKQVAFKKLGISRLPSVLIVHFKRFQVKWETGHIIKIDKFISYPFKLSMDKYWPKAQSEEELRNLEKLPSRNQNPPFNYRLTGVANHFGTRTSSGHYTSYVQKGGQWYYFDDSAVTSNVDRHKIVNGNAYVLFYRRS
ncbi:Ubiquitin carboxyl-terminal hydrolase 4 [Komagataella phaffii CBS 7435]|uniref:Ubiquitin carboxyl-terminal hydrolase n=2 Tax=Komagataella phaffii TaxID=460519 RepID=C4QVQ2_KOMPG|nr:Ubiquitin isopeptidase [Komagataella phaffii GS115]AOA60811.1 GQ67_02524T0 [Komagataella phaffii]CAH2445982.1 Ubiquitin carboxyl-terminal hydrolase 4 [Komagataella phaffii CBS 7435]AOA66636.1 GQ68_02723T0 [Komagataella phaffii GS115]CAY67325.1 Ubiquitin isopeptidase [Komagataella phaffii GS115]CCA36428.1 Ubiquitin carboxyl-terminal hydrolase 4 [Komagataella phaffii CBS 7435]